VIQRYESRTVQLTPTPTTRPTGRGLGRRVADIVTSTELAEGEGDPGPIIAGPAVVPFEAVPVAMLIADPAGETMAVNVKWVQLSGLSTMTSLGNGWLGVVSPENRSKLRADVRRVANTGSSATVDYQLHSAPGRWWRWWLEAYGPAGERLVGIAVADISDRHKRSGRSCPSGTSEQAEPAPKGSQSAVPVDVRAALAVLPDLFDGLDEVLTSIQQLARSGRI
jgi:PAS domain S-box-containing protein